MKQGQIVETPSGDLGRVESSGVSTVWINVSGKLLSFRPQELKKPATVKSFDGKTDVIIKAHQESLDNWPLNLRVVIDSAGMPALVGATYATTKCGCEITGNGTLQFPLTIKKCKKHSV